MSVEWAEYRDQIRGSVLKDDASTTWEDEDLDLYAAWALDAFSAHTARLSVDSWDGDGSLKIFELPSDLYESPEIAGEVYVDNNGTLTFLDPAEYTVGMARTHANAFYVWPEDSLNLITAPPSGSTLYLKYFAYWPHPDSTDDTSELECPQWALPAIGYMMGAHALTQYGSRAASIRQWAEAPEKGTPEHNPLRVQAKYYMDMYERELNRHVRQDRANFFRSF